MTHSGIRSAPTLTGRRQAIWQEDISHGRLKEAPIATHRLHTYCAMCTSHCGVVATVKDGAFTRVEADPAHPNGCICVKGTAAPEIVYSRDRLRHPLVRTQPKGAADPGWTPLSWDAALDLAATRLDRIRAAHGAHSAVFSRATTAGSAAVDFDGWLQRLANAFGSPNLLTSNHICTWNRRVGSKYTYGTGMPTPDFDHTRCMLLWGINPNATSPAQAARISRARSRGAKLIVIDPRRTPAAQRADCWLRVRPGGDGPLAMAMIHVLIEEELYDGEFVRRWTNAPYLMREDNGQLLTAGDLREAHGSAGFVIWDQQREGPAVTAGSEDATGIDLLRAALAGSFEIETAAGSAVRCRTVFSALSRVAARFAPENSMALTTVPAADVRRAARLFAGSKPSCYCTWVGLEQGRAALQTNRAVCCFYSLTGQFDSKGSNVVFDTPAMNAIAGRELLGKEQNEHRLGAQKYPLGPQADPGLVQAAEVYEAILTGRPYPVKALVLFGSDPLLGHGDPLRGRAALEALQFYVHVDTVANPSAQFADLLLPAATCWEREALMPSFDIAEDTVGWVQLRPAVIAPLHDARSDLQILFDLAGRLGLSEHFFGGDIDAAFDYQLAPSQVTAAQLRRQPLGMRLGAPTRYRKFAGVDGGTGKTVGFATPTGKIELYSTTFSGAGYAPLPELPADDDADVEYPLILTFFRIIQFCDEQHRNIARLRRPAPDPFLEIHPETAARAAIVDGSWVSLETAAGRVRLKAKFNAALHPEVVATVYGWWQGCRELACAEYPPFAAAGANANLLIANSDVDPLSASVAHRAKRCRIQKFADD